MRFSMTYDRSAIAKFNIERIDAQTGLGHARFIGRLRLHVIAPHSTERPNYPRLVHISGDIRDADANHVADFRREILPWGVRPDSSVDLWSTVSYRTLSMLNDARKDARQPVLLRYFLLAEYDGNQPWERESFEIDCRIAASDWLGLLDAAKHTEYSVIELPIRGERIPQGLGPVATRYEAAKVHLRLCQWDDAIAECRDVMNELDAAIGASETRAPWAEFSEQARREAWTFQQCLNAIRTMIRHATHGTHHGDHDRRAEEARYIVELVGVAMKYYAQRLR